MAVQSKPTNTTENANSQAQTANKESKGMTAKVVRNGKDITVTFKGKEWVDVAQARKMLGLSDIRTRQLVWDGKLDSIKARVGGRNRVLISTESIRNRGQGSDEVIIIEG